MIYPRRQGGISGIWVGMSQSSAANTRQVTAGWFADASGQRQRCKIPLQTPKRRGNHPTNDDSCPSGGGVGMQMTEGRACKLISMGPLYRDEFHAC